MPVPGKGVDIVFFFDLILLYLNQKEEFFMKKKSCFVVVGQAMPDVKQGKMFLPKHCQVKPDLHEWRSGGFTLIELLVVVLIIGILASVALPQYQVAVAKSRMSQLLALADAVRKAEEVYYLANGRYTQNWEELDIGISGTVQGAVLRPGNGVMLNLREAPFGVTAADSHLPSYLIVGFYNQNEGGTFNGGRSACYAPTADTLGNILCQNISHRKSGDTLNADSRSKRYFF